ncbi:6643_t:CDS:2 [Cetraspora pellucida]|uniref:6643_t:CDS:1 n=1 Tax=Cetraspora pellucida TaxID=1433469 RepID=A0ACA9LQU3_9GLOM|nr:6643_t:CDS:2 [Cetraspora pellucida]
MYENMNVLYSSAIMQYIPIEIIDKVDPEEVPDIQTIAPNAEIGYMPEVDLEVLAHLYDFFADYPLVLKKQIISKNWLSLYNEILISPDIYEVQNKAKANGDEFEVMYYKLKNNAVFGKQMENVYKHMRVELLQTEENKNLGQAILDISKAMMFNFWYDYIKPCYEDKVCLLYTDTNLLIMQIETKNIYKDQAERSDIFDLNYSDDLFLMKNETKGIPIRKTVCLKPKMYSVLPVGHDPKTLDDPDSENSKKKHSIQKAKSVKKYVVKRELQYDKFLECFRNKKLTQHDMYGFCSYVHQIYLERVNKIGLNPYDNKC